jgi:23S rRNA-intervening sequence protein
LNCRKVFRARNILAHRKLSDAESEAAETQVWIEFALKCDYIAREQANELYQVYDEIIKIIVSMITLETKFLCICRVKETDVMLNEVKHLQVRHGDSHRDVSLRST